MVLKKLFSFSSPTHLFTSSYSSSSPHRFLFFPGTASKFSSPTVAATTAWILVWNVSDDKAEAEEKEEGKKRTRTSGDFQTPLGSSDILTSSLTSYLFPILPGNKSCFSTTFSASLLVLFQTEERKCSKKHLTSLYHSNFSICAAKARWNHVGYHQKPHNYFSCTLVVPSGVFVPWSCQAQWWDWLTDMWKIKQKFPCSHLNSAGGKSYVEYWNLMYPLPLAYSYQFAVLL